MGEVYKARDTRLERTVAIKVLPQHLSSSPEIRQRFEREAKTISQLSHPHICALYDVGNQDGVEYLVMEFLEGETLSDRLLKGPLVFDQVLRYGIEIADALDKAHRQGIVHRDLKPGNVMLTKSGVKLLDFGLAKAVQPAAPPSGATALPTMASNPLTQEGSILGTFQYMAPEQLEAREADVRTDIFAFGAVLYEMATGQKAFSGKSQASLISAIMSSEPASIATLAPMTPPALDRVVRTCIAKDPEDRFQTAHDVGLQLKWIAEGGSAAGLLAPVVPRTRSREHLAGGLIGLLAGAILAGFAVRALLAPRPAPPRPPTRFTLSIGADTPIVSAPWNPLAMSRDGRLLAAVASVPGGSQIYLHRFDQSGWTPIAGTEGGASPAFSPDGRWLAFFARGKVKKVSLSGGTPLAICDSGTSYGLAWGTDDVIWFGSAAGLMKVPASGGKTQVGVATQSGQLSLRRPQLLPGGKGILFLTLMEAGAVATRIEAFSLETGRRKVLVEGGYQPVYSSTGHLIYVSAETGGPLLAVSFDARRLELVGMPTPVLEEGVAYFVLSESGTLAYVPSAAAQFNSLVLVDRAGRVQPLRAPAHFFEQPRFSPDGRSAAVCSREGDMDVWIYGVDRGTLVRFTLDPSEDETPVWTPDGRRLAFRRGGKIFWRAADGSGSEELLATSTLNWHLGSFSPDGRLLVLNAIGASGEDIYTLTLGPKATLQPLLQTSSNERSPAVSPDGRWLAYSSDETGRDEIYVQSFSGPGGKVQVSTEGGGNPVWARNGRELFYRSGDRMMAVDVTTGSSFSTSSPHLLFNGRFARAHRDYTNYDTSPDGKRFLMIQGQESDAPQLDVVLDWFTELALHAPPK